MKRSGGLAAAALLVLVFALVEIRATFAQAQRRAITYTDGSRYDGEILNGKRHGLGTYVYSDGSRYSGDWRDGKKHGRGTYTWTDGTRHVGEFRHDNFHGQGIRNWPNGNLYSGDWRDGKKHGRGTYIWADGTRHMGELRNDKFHGRGTRTWPNGNRYEGDWRAGKMHGQGTFTWANGTRHMGELRNDKFHGRGTRTWPNGNRYEGGWRADKMHGRGIFAYPNGNRYEGDWRDNRMHGQGNYTWPDGGRYVGELRNDNFHGRGTRTWPDGRRYEGQWRDDRMHGRGTMIRADGSSYEGEWRDGRRSDRLARERQGQVRQQAQARNAEGRSQMQRNPSDPKAEERGLGLTQGMRKQIQSCLKMQGFDPGPSDGLIGPRTRAAIRSWQVAQSHGQREAGGYLSEGDLSALLAGCQVAEQRELTPEKQTERPAHESQGQRETTEAPELQRQDTDYWSELRRRRQQEQSQATSTRRELERQRQTQRQASERQQQRAEAQSRRQTESVNSAELFRWLKQGESSENTAEILDLLNRGADPNVVDEYGNTPLHYAALASFGEDVLQALIAAGGRCGTGNAAGETPLHHTVNNMNAEFPQAAFIQTLVACGANPSAQDTEGNTPLHMVFLPLADSYRISPSGGSFNDFWGDGGANTLRSLLTNGSNPDIKNRAGDSPLMIALREKTGIMGVRTLLAHGADPNTVDAQGTPALVQSVLDYYGHTRDRTAPIPVIEMLIKAGADPNASTAQGATALHHQLDTAGGSGPIAQTLIALGANPNAQDQRGDTPLHWYVRQPGRGSRLLATLIDSGADPCIQNHNGNTPFDVSADHDYEDHLPECARPDTREHDATTLASAKEAEAERKRWKSLGLVMVRVEGGNFVMGCNEKETSYDYCSHDEKPAHRVRLQSFEIGKYEVTQALWEVVMRNSPSYHKNCPKCPVENVSWAEVQAFLRELNTLTGSAYRLPTEAEWEFAARGGLRSRGYTYAGGHESDIVAWNGNSERSGSQPVGEKQGNELGLYDLSGNVWEWVKDCWNGNYNGAPTDGRAWEQGDCEYRVIRGGSFCYAPDHIFVRNPWSGCTTGSRPDGAKDVGFRLARTIVQ